MKRPLHNTTLYLRRVPADLVRALKAKAALRGTTLTDFLIDALRRALGEEADGDLNVLDAEMAWYESHKRRFLRRYPGEYLAIIGSRVLDHDHDFSALADRVFAKVGIRPVYMPQCVAEERVVHLRSPQIVKP